MSCAEQRQKRWRKALHTVVRRFQLSGIYRSHFPQPFLSSSFSLFLFLSTIKIVTPGSSRPRDFFFTFLAYPPSLSTESSFNIHVYTRSRSHALCLSLSLILSALHLALYLFLRRLKAVDQRRNVYRRREPLKSNRRTADTQHTSGTFSGSTCCEHNPVTPRRAAPRIHPIGRSPRNGPSEPCNGGFIS